MLRAGLVIETATHVSLALTRTPWVAAVTMTVFGAHAAAWGVIALSVRQQATPVHLLGRVSSAYQLLGTGGAAVGAAIGGLAADGLGLTAPFWIAAASMAVLTAVVWRALAQPALSPS